MVTLPKTVPNEFTPDEDGVIRVGGTRVTLESILTLHRRGESVDEINFAFNSVGRSNIIAAIEYSRTHAAEVEEYLARQAEWSRAVRAEYERRFPSEGLRERLEARRRKLEE